MGGHAECYPGGQQHAPLGQRIDELERVRPGAAEPEVETSLRFDRVESVGADAIHHHVAALAIWDRIDLPRVEMEQRALRRRRRVDKAERTQRLGETAMG